MSFSNHSFNSGSASPASFSTSGNNNNNNNAATANGNQPQQQQQQLAGTNYRSKFAGMPGSASALHVHFGFKNSAPAFDPLPSDHPSAVARREARQWAQGSRLGQKQEWDITTTNSDTGGHPRRQLMHQLSEFQAPKIVYNFRAQEVPSVHKQSVSVWKSGKFKVDQTSFLTKKDRTIAGHHVLGNTNVLSHAEMPITEDPEKQEREASWNNSTALAHERASLFVKREEADYRALNRTKAILDHDRYVNPIHDVKRKNEEKREMKRQDRQAQEEFVAKMKQEARSRRGLKPLMNDSSISSSTSRGRNLDGQVFKMSNIDSWWNNTPPEVQEATRVLEIRRQAEEERNLKLKAEQDARMMNQQQTTLRVVNNNNNNEIGSSNQVSAR